MASGLGSFENPAPVGDLKGTRGGLALCFRLHTDSQPDWTLEQKTRIPGMDSRPMRERVSRPRVFQGETPAESLFSGIEGLGRAAGSLPWDPNGEGPEGGKILTDDSIPVLVRNPSLAHGCCTAT